MTDYIRVRGARTHNLKNISADIPRNALTVITGLSGSGKSSLAFDTLYAEGQRRYVESLSAYARQFLQLMEKPDVDTIDGLSPAIAIDQKTTSHNPRSTIGTVTEIYDYLRLLFARTGTPYCPDHPEQALSVQSVSQMVDYALSLPEGTRLMILSPVVSARKGEYQNLFDELLAKGFVRFRIQSGTQDAVTVTAEDIPVLKKNVKHSIDVVVDRLRINGSARQRLAESFETALSLSEGKAIALDMDTGKETVFSDRFGCPACGYSLTELEPRTFSFNNPMGACPHCDGLGTVSFFDENLITEPMRTLKEGAIAMTGPGNEFYHAVILDVAEHYGIPADVPFEKLPEAQRHILIHGSGKDELFFPRASVLSRYPVKEKPFIGALKMIEKRHRTTESVFLREELTKYISHAACPSCGGARLKRESRHVKVGNPDDRKAIHEITAMPISESLAWFKNLKPKGHIREISERITREIVSRLTFLNDVGLGYLQLSRGADTISGGESQRIRLASQIGSALTGVMYVLDEPSIGLHQRDNMRLLSTLKHLRDLGNSVIVVEHDEEAIRNADCVIDIGPGAGNGGGRIVAIGTPREIESADNSLTADYLSGRRTIPVPEKRIANDPDRQITLEGASGNNLKNVTMRLPCGLLTCVTGVSGSGKSTLVNETLYKVIAGRINRTNTNPAPHTRVSGLELIDKIISVDQAPIGRTPRSNPATYTGLFTPIRELFAQTPDARERGYSPGRFSFNVKGGRCETCQGDGVIRVEMHFLPDMYVPCDVCRGKRYNRETLEILYRGKSISDVLDMTVEEASEFFSAIPAVARRLKTLTDTGLGYIRLGQNATTLSGGEAQRIKLSLELSKRDTGNTLYILDEPTTGLHFHDINMLIGVLTRLRDAGNTVCVIEHNLDVIKTADWIIDLGPEGGSGGGEIIACGTPEDVAANPESHTGRYLGDILNPKKRGK